MPLIRARPGSARVPASRSAIRSSASSSPIWSRTSGPPKSGVSRCGAPRIDRQRQALEPAPAVADAEMVEPVDQRRAAGLVAAVEHEREQPARALEIARATGACPGSSGSAGWSTRATSGAALQPARDLAARLASCCFSRTASVRRPRLASQQSSGLTTSPSSSAVARSLRETPGRGGDRCPASRPNGRRHIWCRRGSTEIDAVRDRREQQRRRPGVVEHRGDARAPSRPRRSRARPAPRRSGCPGFP